MSLLQSDKSHQKQARTRVQNRAETPQLSAPAFERLLDALPGFLVWMALCLCIVMSVFSPRIMLFFALFLTAYCTLRFVVAGIASLIGNTRIHRWEQRNWYDEYLNTADTHHACAWEDVHHVVLIPNFNESVDVLRQSLAQLAKWEFAKHQMTVILAMETAETHSSDKARQLISEYNSHFASMFYTCHPTDLYGEIQCKSANLAWAGQWLRRNLFRIPTTSQENIVVTTMDADTNWHKHYFSALTYFFITNPERHTTFWQAPIRYHNNIWQVNPMVRLINAYSSAFELAYLTAGWWLALPISSYSMSFTLLETSRYWDSNVISDEWHMFAKSFFATNAALSIQSIYLPFSAFATTGETVWIAIRNRYAQTLRHAWGSKEIGYIIKRMTDTPSVPVYQSVTLLIRVVHDLLLSSAGWIVLSVGSVLPFVLYPSFLDSMGDGGSQFSPILFFQFSAIAVFMLGIIFWRIDVSVRPERGRAMTHHERFWSVASLFLLPILTMFCVTLPVIHAQTLLMIGTTIPFEVSRKV